VYAIASGFREKDSKKGTVRKRERENERERVRA
jgi:hypothetical protein